MKTALFIGFVWPEPKTTAAGHRMLQLLTSFKKKGFDIIFACTAQETNYSEDLSKLDITRTTIKLNDSSFDEFIKKLKLNIVVFDRFMVEEQFGWRVVESVPNALRILNTEDLHSLRNTREVCHKKGEEFTTEKWMENDMAKREIASIYRSDLTLLISPTETELLKTVFHIPEDLLFTLPFMVEAAANEKKQELPSFEERKDFLFIGNGKHAPNLDAIKYLKTSIWPLIRQELPQSNLNIYGAYLPQQVTEMNKPSEGFNVHGWAEDLDETMQQAKVNLAPLRFGAGLKGKVIDGMRNGTPTITTAIGAEGIPNYTDYYDKPTDFAQKAIETYCNKEAWLLVQKSGFNTIKNHFSEEQLIPILFHEIDLVSQQLEAHRSKNFFGALLMHQTMASTKYMSKWIEEKNRKTL
ncbi:glycosyltransferase [Croceitalea marina]|uniref:Glycosyltransferase n=1 Tax=Croceitalea marina TaxID=1775166 RepID=A0ABW5MVG7_9FLAO